MTGDDDGDASGFAGLALAPELCRALSGLGYEEPTPIQRAAILVLVPTRELAVQVSEAVFSYGRGMGARVLPICDEEPIGRPGEGEELPAVGLPPVDDRGAAASPPGAISGAVVPPRGNQELRRMCKRITVLPGPLRSSTRSQS